MWFLSPNTVSVGVSCCCGVQPAVASCGAFCIPTHAVWALSPNTAAAVFHVVVVCNLLLLLPVVHAASNPRACCVGPFSRTLLVTVFHV